MQSDLQTSDGASYFVNDVLGSVWMILMQEQIIEDKVGNYLRIRTTCLTNSWHRLVKITLPLLRPTILYVLVTSLIGGMQIFDIPMTLTKGTGEPQKSLMTMVLYLYNMAFKNNDLPYGATISYGIFAIIIIFSLLFFKVLYGKKEEN